MNFIFYYNQSEEAEVLNCMLSEWSGTSPEVRAKQYGIPIEIAKTCLGDGDVSQPLRSFLSEMYVLYAAELEQSLAFHRQFWQGRGADYVDAVERAMEYKLPDYTVRLSVQLGGMSDWGGENIAINAFCYLYADKLEHIRIILWEMILSQTFQAVRRKYPAEVIDDNLVWGIAELTSLAVLTDILHLNEDFEFGDYLQLNPYISAIKGFYRERVSFSEYLDTAVAYVRKQPFAG